MPGLSCFLDDNPELVTHPELFKLMLPSQLSLSDRESWCPPSLTALEAKFQYAQANNALAKICQLQQLFQGLSDQNKKHITSTQATMTHSLGTFEWYKTRIQRFATLYHCARNSLIALDLKGEMTKWTSCFLELKDTDIRGPGRDLDNPSEGQNISSWIWVIAKPSQSSNIPLPNASTSNSEDSDLSSHAASGEEVALSIRAHWARCQARAERYKEEVQLTVEEMQRSLEFFKWKSHWWLTLLNVHADSVTPPDLQVQHGLQAYVYCQASMYSSLVDTYVNHWRKFLIKHSLGLTWLKLYPVQSTPPAKSTTAGVDRLLDVDQLLSVDGPLLIDEDEGEPDCEDPTFNEIFDDLFDD